MPEGAVQTVEGEKTLMILPSTLPCMGTILTCQVRCAAGTVDA